MAIDDLRPTQMCVGLREVAIKRQRWRQRNRTERAAMLMAQPSPVVAGPLGRFYLLDGHHLVRALYDEGESALPVRLVADLSDVRADEFWDELRPRGWLYACCPGGEWVGASCLPPHVRDMVDDPYRSLAGELRRRGGFDKAPTPFSEFAWADFLRRHIDPEELARSFGWGVARALELAGTSEAAHLPGWHGELAETLNS